MSVERYDNASATPRMEMGGQAVMEGVLMRSRTGYAVALRRWDDAILIRQVPYRTLASKIPTLRLPVIRGFVALVEMMALGTRSLRWSAEVFEEGLRRKENPADAPSEAHEETKLPTSMKDAANKAEFAGLMAVSLGIVILMVVVAPNLLALLVGKVPFVHGWAEGRGTLGFTEENHPFAFNIVSGVFRALILFLYMWAISLNKDIRRIFQYHGAEHKAVLALEAGEDLTVANAQAHDTLHPRCGTTFVAVVILVSILFFAVVAAILAAYVPGFPEWNPFARKGLTFLSHIIVLPLVAGTSFEIMKFCARHMKNPLCRALLAPGFLFQRVTTKQPADDQVEVALVSLLAALAIAPEQEESKEYVVRGLQDDETAPGYQPVSPIRVQEAMPS